MRAGVSPGYRRQHGGGRHGLGRLAVAPVSSVAPRRLTMCEQLPLSRQRRWPEVLSTAGSSTTVKECKMTNMPEIVSAEKWQQDRDELLKAEKEATRAIDALAARRRRLPMARFDSNRYVFGTSAGPKTLLDLFARQRQLVVYQFMDNGPDDYCP